MTPELKALVLDLHAIEAIRFGSFTLRTGLITPFYIDLRVIIAYPALLKRLSRELGKLLAPLQVDLVCAVPFAALSIATAVSLELEVPMLFRRPEAKEYGTKKLIEGVYQKGQRCLIIEDVIVYGTSVLETTHPLRNAGLEVEDVVVVVDREQGGKANLQKHGLFLHPLLSIVDILKVLFHEKRIDEATFRAVNAFLATAP